jgi:hypothetical protein
MTIRASQIMPVYPLTEDLLPGDVFITSTPIGEEQRYFREESFLPFDDFVARLGVNEKIATALGASYSKQFRDASAAQKAKFPAGVEWPGMPIAGFPSYSVITSRPTKAGSTRRRRWTCSRAGSSAGRWLHASVPGREFRHDD